jgi:CPA1 family monovalent cation:H+ antiporter
LLQAERQALIELRRTGEIDDEVVRRVMRDLDLEELQLQPTLPPETLERVAGTPHP